jgi:hypothetical protein
LAEPGGLARQQTPLFQRAHSCADLELPPRHAKWPQVRKAGLDPVEARDGAEAFAAVVANPPGHFSCILMDLQMPVLDGGCQQLVVFSTYWSQGSQRSMSRPCIWNTPEWESTAAETGVLSESIID